MGNLINLAAESQASFLADDTTPGLTVRNTSTGIALDAVGDTSSTANPGLRATFSANVAGASVAPLNVTASTVSQAVLSISGVFISTASINLAANKTAFIIPVYHETQRVFGYVAASIGPS